MDKQKRKANFSNLVFGKLPPQDINAEMAVLGAIMLEKDRLEEVLEVIPSAEIFYTDAHQKIFTAILKLFKDNRPVDLLSVTDYLRKDESLELVGGAYYLTTLTGTVSSSAHIVNHAFIIKEHHIKREQIRIGGNMVTEAYDDNTDALDLLEKSSQRLFELSSSGIYRTADHIKNSIIETVMQHEDQRLSSNDFSGVPTGFIEIDKCTAGWQKTDLIIIAARPSVGKTAFALNLAVAAARANMPVAFFSLEMGKSQLVKRVLANVAGIDLGGLIQPKTQTDADGKLMTPGAEKLMKMPIYLDDTAALNITQLRTKARQLKRKHDIQLLVIDYLQLMGADRSEYKGNREQEISQISRNLKVLAKDLDIPIIALSQLNRVIESRADSEPKLSDLRESGAIEQDADIIGFLYQSKDPSLSDNVIFSVKKHRNGSLKEFILTFIRPQQRFTLPTSNVFGVPEFENPYAGMRSVLPPEKEDSPF